MQRLLFASRRFGLSWLETGGVLVLGLGLEVSLLGTVAGLLARIFPRRERWIGFDPLAAFERILAAGLIAAGTIVIGVTILGSCNLLDSRIAWICFTVPGFLLVHEDLRRGFLELVAAARAAGTFIIAAASKPFPDRFVVAGLATAWCVLFLDAVVLPPVAWDALTYHLFYPLHWMQSGELTTLFQPVGDPSIPYFPLVGEMLLYWGFLVTGSDWWAPLSQVPAAILGSIALAGIALQCGAKGKVAALSAALWLSLPIVLRQSVEPMVDVVAASFYFAGVFFLFRACAGSPTRSLLLAAVAIGLAAGTKYVSAFFAMALGPLAVGALASHARARGRVQSVPITMLAAALVAVLSGYSYARNAWIGRNPLLPMAVSIAGVTILPGPEPAGTFYGDDLHKLTVRSFFFSPRAVLDLGPLFAVFLVAPLFVKRVARTQPKQVRARQTEILLLAVFIFALFLALPYRSHRFLLIFAGLSAVLTGVVFPRPNALLAVVSAQVPFALYYWVKEIILGGIQPRHLVLISIGAAVVASMRARSLRIRALSVTPPKSASPSGEPEIGRHSPRLRFGGRQRALVAGVLAIAGISLCQKLYEERRFDVWLRFWGSRYTSKDLLQRRDLAETAQAWRRMAEVTETESKPATIAWVGNNLPYPLTGPFLRNRVRFVPRNERIDSMVLGWKTRLSDLTAEGDPSQWIANLDMLGVDYLCAFRRTGADDPEETFPVEAHWAEERPDFFPKLLESHWARIYRFERDEGFGLRNGQ